MAADNGADLKLAIRHALDVTQCNAECRQELNTWFMGLGLGLE